MSQSLNDIIKFIAQPSKGILAADESIPTITKRFNSINLESTQENRRAYRELIFSTPHLGDYVSGAILFEETLNDRTNQEKSFVALLKQQGIIPGIKVDKGLIPFLHAPDEKITQGLDGLNERLSEYKKTGAEFAKWRAVFNVPPQSCSPLLIDINANRLAMYAAICQSHDVVPIVEPEILMDGDHTIEQCALISETVLHAVFSALFKHKVMLEYIILKPSMILSGKSAAKISSSEQIADATLSIFNRTVPAAVPSINFLSGGQSPEQASKNLNAINLLKPSPWNLSFSYGRALLDPCLKTWMGQADNIQAAQQALLKRAKLNSAAAQAKYTTNMENK